MENATSVDVAVIIVLCLPIQVLLRQGHPAGRKIRASCQSTVIVVYVNKHVLVRPSASL